MNKIYQLLTVLLFVTTTTISFPLWAYSSVYTSLEKCRVIESSDNEPEAQIDYFTEECPGKNDYQIFHEGGDLKSWIIIKKNDKVVTNLQQVVMQNAPGHFPHVSGKVIEWRYLGKTPVAVIFRIAGSNDTSTKTKSQLLVIRLVGKKACLIGTTTSNEEARKIADGKKMCQ